jgi:hypothetical protein
MMHDGLLGRYSGADRQRLAAATLGGFSSHTLPATESPATEPMDDEPQTKTDRRTRELARRANRKRKMNVVGTVLTLAIVALVALVATDTLRLGASGPTLTSGKSVTPATAPSDPGPAVAKLKRKEPPRPLSHAAPLRLWIGGDSIAGDLGYQLGPLVAKLGIVRAHVDYKVSSGLASDNVRDWPNEFTQEESQYQPEAVIFMVGANDAPIVGNNDWETTYRGKVDHMMDLLIGGSAQRTVFWIGSPILGGSHDHGVEDVNRVMREEAAKRPTVVYIDAYSLFSVNAVYARSFPDAEGNTVTMRTGDGEHLTPAGGLFLAQHVDKLLDARWNLTGQADPSSPIEYTIEPKSGTIGGVHLGNGNDGSGGSNNSGSGSPTTTHTTAAPTTTAPKTTSTTAPKSTTTTKPPTTTTSTAKPSPPAP